MKRTLVNRQSTTRKLLQLFLLCAVLLAPKGAWAQFTFGGLGTEESPYTIESASQLKEFADAVNKGTSTDGLYFRIADLMQTGSIDCSTITGFTPIGTNQNPFKGTFDGNGSNLSLAYLTVSVSGTGYNGLFGVVDGGTIKNVSLHTCTFTGGNMSGAIVGELISGTIEDCSVISCSVTTSGAVNSPLIGGVVGLNLAGTVSNCTVKGRNTITASTTSEDGIPQAGGVAGEARGGATISGCVVEDATISSSHNECYAGGIVGSCTDYAGYVSITGCSVKGTTTVTCQDSGESEASRAYAGAIAGSKSSNADFSNNYYYYTVKAISLKNNTTTTKENYEHRGLGVGIQSADSGTEYDLFAVNGAVMYTKALTLNEQIIGYSDGFGGADGVGIYNSENNNYYFAPGQTVVVPLYLPESYTITSATLTYGETNPTTTYLENQGETGYLYSFVMPDADASFIAEAVSNDDVYDLWIGNTQVTENNMNDVLGDNGSVTFTATGGQTTAPVYTLTLNNATLTAPITVGLNLTIDVKGTNSITVPSGNVILKNQNSQSQEDFNLTLKTSTANGYLTLTSISEETIDNGGVFSYGLNKSIDKSLGLLQPNDSYYLTNGSSEYHTARFVPSLGVTIGGTPIYSGNAEDVFEDGKVSFSNNTLTLNGADLNGPIESNIEELTIKIAGNNSLTLSYDGPLFQSQLENATITIGQASNATGMLVASINSSESGIPASNVELSIEDPLVVLSGELRKTSKSSVIIGTKLFRGGDGSADSPYLIGSTDDLLNFSNWVNSGAVETERKYFQLNDDIDFTNESGYNFQPVGYEYGWTSYPFKGTFNGNNKKIIGLNVSSNFNYAGLFGLVGSNSSTNGVSGSISLVTLENCNFEGSGNVGTVAGKLANGIISNCIVDGCTISASKSSESVYAGGIVGNCSESTTISGNRVKGVTTIYAESESDNVYSGAISGCKSGAFTDNLYYPTVITRTKVGNNDVLEKSGSQQRGIGEVVDELNDYYDITTDQGALLCYGITIAYNDGTEKTQGISSGNRLSVLKEVTGKTTVWFNGNNQLVLDGATNLTGITVSATNALKNNELEVLLTGGNTITNDKGYAISYEGADNALKVTFTTIATSTGTLTYTSTHGTDPTTVAAAFLNCNVTLSDNLTSKINNKEVKIAIPLQAVVDERNETAVVSYASEPTAYTAATAAAAAAHKPVSIVMNNILYTLNDDGSVGSPDGFNTGAIDNGLVLNSKVSEYNLNQALSLDPTDDKYAEYFKGLTFMLLPGSGEIEFEAWTQQAEGQILCVKIGDLDPERIMLKLGKETYKVSYDVSENTYVRIYLPASGSAAPALLASHRIGPKSSVAGALGGVKVTSSSIQMSTSPALTYKMMEKSQILSDISSIVDGLDGYTCSDNDVSDLPDDTFVPDGGSSAPRRAGSTILPDRLTFVDFSETQITGMEVSRTEGAFNRVPDNVFIYMPAGNSVAKGTKNVVIGGICDVMELNGGVDAEPFKAKKNFKAGQATLKRTFEAYDDKNENAPNTATIYLPYAISQEDADNMGTFWQYESNDGTTVTMSQVTTGGLKANMPYIFKAKAGGLENPMVRSTEVVANPSETDGFKGVYVHKDYESGMYCYAAEGNVGQFVEMGTGSYVPPFRAYMIGSGAPSYAILWDGVLENMEEEPNMTAVETVKTAQDKKTAEGWWTLNGVRLNGQPQKPGMYIVNGRLVVVK